MKISLPALRVAVALAEAAREEIERAGVEPPGDADLIAAMIPSARQVVRTARWASGAITQFQVASAAAAAAAKEASDMSDAVASAWISAAAGDRELRAQFDAIVSTLGDIDQAGSDP